MDFIVLLLLAMICDVRDMVPAVFYWKSLAAKMNSMEKSMQMITSVCLVC